MSSRVYAIDFGTSNSLLATAHQGKVEAPLALDTGNADPTVFRSLMYFPPDKNQVVFGSSAIQAYADDSGAGRFIRSVKKYLPSKQFRGTMINGQKYGLEDLIGCFLREMKTRADSALNQDVSSVVLGRPAKFSLDQDSDRLAQQRLEDAAKAAGFKHITFFPEPLAAAYDYRTQIDKEKLLLVVDLGGGTSDFTVIRLQPGRGQNSEVLSLGGVSIAGDALDGSLMSERVAPYFGSKVKYRMPMSSNVLQMPPDLKLRLASPADITLMSQSDIMHFLNDVKKCTVREEDDEALERLFALIDGNYGFALFERIEALKRQCCEGDLGKFSFRGVDIDVAFDLKADEFVDLTEEKISRIFEALDETLGDAQVSTADIDAICLTGGTSKVPAVRQRLEQRFGKNKVESFRDFHSVIYGLAERAAELTTS